MADFQIGDNLYSEDTGKYYNLNNGQKSYIKSPYETSQEKINQMYDAQQNSQLNTLKAQRDKAIGGFNQQKKELTPQYANQRNQADVVNSQNVTRLRELMAANGINMSGENVTAQANMNSARQGSFNDINNNENQAMGAIDKQIANENDPSRERSINDAIAAERSRSLNDAFGQSQQQAYQQKMDWQNYQQQLKQQEYQKQIDAQNYAMQKAQFDLEQQMRQLNLQKAQAAASSGGSSGGGGGGGSSSRKTSTASAKKPVATKTNALSSAYQQYQNQKKQSTVVDQYYNSINDTMNKGQSVVKKPLSVDMLYKKYGIAPQTIADNKNLSAWQKMKLMGG
jgi:hypothetical protein